MANAFVAIADDATAASWNPAGLVQLEEPEFSIVGSFNSVFERLSAEAHSEVDRWTNSQGAELNFLSLTWPIPVTIKGRNVTVGLYYQRKYEFERKVALNFNDSNVVNNIVFNRSNRIRFDQHGGLSALSPGFAFELTNRLSLGLTLNLWRDTFLGKNGWEQETSRRTFAQDRTNLSLSQANIKETYKDFRGENVSVGILWAPTDRWSFGARWDSGFTGKVDYEIRSVSRTRGAVPVPLRFRRNTERRELRFPDTYAAGIAFRPNDRLVVSADVSMTNWNDFYVKEESGNRVSLVNAQPVEDNDFDDTYTIRLGGEYVFIPKNPGPKLDRLWTVRGGLFYDQEPASGHPEDFYGIAIGAGLLFNQRVNVDVAYQMRWGPDVNAENFRGFEADEDVFQSRVLLSTVIYLGKRKASIR